MTVSSAVRLSEFLIVAKNSMENPYIVWRSVQKSNDNSVSMVTFHRNKNNYSINKSKTIGSVTSPKTVLTLIWQVTAKVIIIPPVLTAILACFTKVNNAFYTALDF